MKLFRFYSWCLGLGLIMTGGMWLAGVVDDKFWTTLLTVSIICLWVEAGTMVLFGKED